jgi:hypothetical protein
MSYEQKDPQLLEEVVDLSLSIKLGVSNKLDIFGSFKESS